ncbi:hypothetical protein [Chamaesiphon sp.]
MPTAGYANANVYGFAEGLARQDSLSIWGSSSNGRNVSIALDT